MYFGWRGITHHYLIDICELEPFARILQRIRYLDERRVGLPAHRTVPSFKLAHTLPKSGETKAARNVVVRRAGASRSFREIVPRSSIRRFDGGGGGVQF